MTGPYATECLLELCVQHYTATVHDGVFHKLPSGSPALLSDMNASLIENLTYEGGAFKQDEIEYNIDMVSITQLWFYFTAVFQGEENYMSPNDDEVDWSTSKVEWSSDITQSIYIHLKDTPHTLDAMFANLARSLTLTLRSQMGSMTQALWEFFHSAGLCGRSVGVDHTAV